MSTLQKFAALPIDKYIDILDKLKSLKDSVSPVVTTPVKYQERGGGDNEIIGQRGGQSDSNNYQSDREEVAPPPGLPVEDEMVNGSSEVGGTDNWIDVWQTLK